MMSGYLYLFVVLYGFALGSFFNVLIYRLPLMLKAEWTAQCCTLLNQPLPFSEKPVNLFFPRSFCPNCHAQVKIWQNIPLLSYLFLKGRCYYCKTAISLRYPGIECLTGLLFLLASWEFGFTLQLLFALIFISLIICLFFIDFDTQLLPDSLTLSLLWAGLIANTAGLFIALPDAVFGAAGAYMGLWLFIKLFYCLTGKIGMGNGDFKLFAAFGAWFGASMLPLILLFSCIAGSITGFLYLHIAKKSKDTPIAFGPFLCVAGLIALFWGKAILSWYLY